MRLDTQMIIAGNLRTLRLTKRLSQGDMADYIGSSRGLYAHYELGNRTPDAEALYTIANRLGIDMATLFERDPDKFFSYLANNCNLDEETRELVSIYKELSPFSRGMLMERAAWLLEKEQEKTAGGPSQKMTEPSEHNKLTLKLPSANAE